MNLNCTIQWNSLTTDQWEKRFATIRRANLLQSYDYARAICPLNNQRGRWGLIEIDGQEAGLVQLLEIGIFNNMIHIVILDRGPLWFEGFGSAAHIDAFFTIFNKEFPARLGRWRRIIPESTARIAALPQKRKKQTPPYQTIWLDLQQDEDKLRKNLKKNWRGGLKKAEKETLELVIDKNGADLPWLLAHYQGFMREKGLKTARIELIQALSRCFAPKKNMLILSARYKGHIIAGILIFIHGQSATYQIGWSDAAQGRQYNAHHFLLWQAMLDLKQRGIKDFDLGGINDQDAKGVRDFKAGMGGESVELCGQYR